MNHLNDNNNFNYKKNNNTDKCEELKRINTVASYEKLRNYCQQTNEINCRRK